MRGIVPHTIGLNLACSLSATIAPHAERAAVRRLSPTYIESTRPFLLPDVGNSTDRGVCHCWAGSEFRARAGGVQEGTQAQWSHDLLEPEAERVVVCNLRGRSQTSNKSDRIDSDRLSEMLRISAVKSAYHGARSMLTLKQLVRCDTNLVDDTTRVTLRIKALFRARAIPTPGSSVYRPSNRAAWLGKIESRGARMRAASLLQFCRDP
jgi:hypothetical protein